MVGDSDNGGDPGLTAQDCKTKALSWTVDMLMLDKDDPDTKFQSIGVENVSKLDVIRTVSGGRKYTFEFCKGCKDLEISTIEIF